MATEAAQSFQALESQAQQLLAVFTKAGHEAVAPAIIQPADIYLDVIGESLRARTYVFTDPNGAELCLRPDLTVPTCRLHIARNGSAPQPARYCYNGPAFRFQPQGADDAHPREFRQAGIERFGDVERERAESETVSLVIKAIEAVGLKSWTLQTGDLGLFQSVLDAVRLPTRWKRRLANAFARPGAFRAELKRLATGSLAVRPGLAAELMGRLQQNDVAASEAAVLAYLDERNIDVVGVRTISEITEHLLSILADETAERLEPETATLIDQYASIGGPALTAGERVGALLKGVKGGPGAALDAYDRRLALLANAGIDLSRVSFSAEFGRTLAYYTGFVFEVSAPGLKADGPIAGGGRYDGLLRAAGAATDMAAVGAAIHTERLLAKVTRDRLKGAA